MKTEERRERERRGFVYQDPASSGLGRGDPPTHRAQVSRALFISVSKSQADKALPERLSHAQPVCSTILPQLPGTQRLYREGWCWGLPSAHRVTGRESTGWHSPNSRGV